MPKERISTSRTSWYDCLQPFLSIIITDNLQLGVRWNDRQFSPPFFVLKQIDMGAPRNFIIKGGAGRLTEDSIRSDLDHIQYLVVIDVKFKEGDIYISTNSVRHAL